MDIYLHLAFFLLFALSLLNYFFIAKKVQYPKFFLVVKIIIWLFVGMWIIITPDARTTFMLMIYAFATFMLLKQAWQVLQKRQHYLKH